MKHCHISAVLVPKFSKKFTFLPGNLNRNKQFMPPTRRKAVKFPFRWDPASNSIEYGGLRKHIQDAIMWHE